MNKQVAIMPLLILLNLSVSPSLSRSFFSLQYSIKRLVSFDKRRVDHPVEPFEDETSIFKIQCKCFQIINRKCVETNNENLAKYMSGETLGVNMGMFLSTGSKIWTF